MPINVSKDDYSLTMLKRFKGLADQNVLLALANGKELYVYAETRNDCLPVDFGGDEDSKEYKNLEICDVYVSDNAKFYVIGVPEKKAFGIFSFNRSNFISAPVRWITNISFTRFWADDLLSSVLFMNEDRKTLDHHFLLWKFDTSKLDHKALHKLDVGLLGNGEANDFETDYGTEGDETPGGLDGVEKVNSSSCCIMF